MIFEKGTIMVDELKARAELITLLDEMRERALTAAPVEIDFGQLAETITNTEFDHPFMIVDGRVVDVNEMSIKPGKSYRPTVYAPSVYHVEDTTDIMIDGGGWEAVSYGMTGQYGYNGPVMHASEYVGPGIAETLAEYEPGTIFVMCVVETLDDDEEPAGWVILRKDSS